MSSAVLLLVIPLAWLVVTTVVVAACRVTAQADADVPRSPDWGAGGLSAVSSMVPCRSRIALGGRVTHAPQRREQVMTALVMDTGRDVHMARFRRQPTSSLELGSPIA